MDVVFRSRRHRRGVQVGRMILEDEAKKVLLEDEIEILVDMNIGAAGAAAWGCDLTYDYVKINGDYRT